MLVCICNRLSETRIDQAIALGARTPLEVFKGCGARRTCPNCSNTIRSRIARVVAQSGTAPAE